MFETFIAIGIIISLIYQEKTDISPGGLITPGYLALFMDQPLRLLSTLILSVLTYLILLITRKFIPLHGRRQFALALTIAILLKLLFKDIIIGLPQASVTISSIGVIIPGLIANDMEKQGVLKTIPSIIIVSAFLFAVLILLKGIWV